MKPPLFLGLSALAAAMCLVPGRRSLGASPPGSPPKPKPQPRPPAIMIEEHYSVADAARNPTIAVTVAAPLPEMPLPKRGPGYFQFPESGSRPKSVAEIAAEQKRAKRAARVGASIYARRNAG